MQLTTASNIYTTDNCFKRINYTSKTRLSHRPCHLGLLDQIALISQITETLQDHLNLTKPRQILPKATKASPTAPNLRNFAKNTPSFTFNLHSHT